MLLQGQHQQHLPQRQHQTHQVTIELYFSTFQKFWNNRNVLCAAKSTTPVHNEATPNTPTAHAAPRATPAASAPAACAPAAAPPPAAAAAPAARQIGRAHV